MSRTRSGRCKRSVRSWPGVASALVALGLLLSLHRPLRAEPRSVHQHSDTREMNSQTASPRATVAMVSSAAIAGVEVLESPRYRMTAMARPRWLVMALPALDTMTPPSRDAVTQVPTVALTGLVGVSAARSRAWVPSRVGEDGTVVQRLSWEELVCPG